MASPLIMKNEITRTASKSAMKTLSDIQMSSKASPRKHTVTSSIKAAI